MGASLNDTITRCASAVVPGTVCVIGMSVPLASAVIGTAACLMVRFAMFKRRAFINWTCFTGLSVLGTVVTVSDHDIGPGLAFWIGIGFAAVASSLPSIGKAVMGDLLTERLQAAGRVLFGIKGP